MGKVQGGAMKNAEEQIKNAAEELAYDFCEGRYSQTGGYKFTVSELAKALQAAYQKGAEDMKNKLQPWNYLKTTPEGCAR